MVKGMAVAVVLLLAVAAASASTYTVTKKADIGTGTLRWAIEQANAHVGPDQIRFASELSGAVILPLTPLPALTDNRTAINGDINGDHIPDVAINGKNALPPLGPGPVSGLAITGRRCVVRGLAVVAFSGSGIMLSATRYCQVVGCYLGVNLQGTQTKPLGQSGVSIVRGGYNSIGGASAAERNVFGPSANLGYGGVLIYRSSGNIVSGNYFGLAADGIQVLGWVHYAVSVNGLSGPAEDNVIGGEDPGAGNVFGGCHWGAFLSGATNTQILGNLFGLKADGDTLAPMSTGVRLASGTTETQIGGTTAGARNVFAGGATYGIDITDPGTAQNAIQGNYFGTNQAGTARRRLTDGVVIWYNAGWQLIGGTAPAAGNHFAAFDPNIPCQAIRVSGPGSAQIRNNSFGLLPAGGSATGITDAVFVHAGGTAKILDNTIALAAGRGVWVKGSGSTVSVFGNLFRHCHKAVAISNNGICRLGNLGNVNTNDDGGNEFKPSNDWTIWNTTPNTVKAEGNDFDTTSMAAIDAKILDKLDCPSAGRVDFVPLTGGVIPTGGTAPALAITSAAVAPSFGRGAEVSFTLSAPADVTVTVLNIAGRPVATVVRDVRTDAGVDRLVWSGQTLNGTPAPPGAYLVRIAARNSDGVQASALCTLRLER